MACRGSMLWSASPGGQDGVHRRHAKSVARHAHGRQRNVPCCTALVSPKANHAQVGGHVQPRDGGVHGARAI